MFSKGLLDTVLLELPKKRQSLQPRVNEKCFFSLGVADEQLSGCVVMWGKHGRIDITFMFCLQKRYYINCVS